MYNHKKLQFYHCRAEQSKKAFHHGILCLPVKFTSFPMTEFLVTTTTLQLLYSLVYLLVVLKNIYHCYNNFCTR